jgi:hypothetical protein
MEHDKVESPTLFDWYGDGSQSIGTYKSYTATIHYVSGDMVFVLQVTMPTNPVSHVTLDYIASYDEAKNLADLVVLEHESTLMTKFKNCLRIIGLPY